MRTLTNIGLIGLSLTSVACASQAREEPLVIVQGKAPALLSTVTTNDPYFKDQWQLHNEGPFTTLDGKGKINGADHAHIADAWALILDLELAKSVSEIGKDVRLAIIDDGFDLAHEEISSKIVASKNFGNAAIESGNLFSNTSPTSNFHGMLVTGIAAAAADNGKGISGVCPGCKLVLARIADDAGDSQGLKPEDYYDNVFDWVTEQEADVINASWGPEKSTSAERMQALLDKLNKKGRKGLGINAVFAAGNGDEDFAWNHFAASDDTISVGGTDSKGVRHAFSNFGVGLDLMAPTSAAEKQSAGLGNTYIDRIWTTDNYLAPSCLAPGATPSSGCSDTAGWSPTKPTAGGDGWVGKYSYRFSHTSAAAPVVSGVVGLMLHVNPKLTSREVRAILAATADKVAVSEAQYDDTGVSTKYGFGRVNALRAVAFAHLTGEGKISDSLRDDIDARSPCTRTDCWDLAGAAPTGGSEPDRDGGTDGEASGGGGSGTTGSGAGEPNDEDAGGKDDSESDTSKKSGGCAVSGLAARTASTAATVYLLFGALALWLRRRRA